MLSEYSLVLIEVRSSICLLFDSLLVSVSAETGVTASHVIVT